MNEQLIEGEDFVMEHGLMVLTAKYLLKRGHCCENDCRNCPYKENNPPKTEQK